MQTEPMLDYTSGAFGVASRAPRPAYLDPAVMSVSSAFSSAARCCGRPVHLRWATVAAASDMSSIRGGGGRQSDAGGGKQRPK
jgi:hypothetical protein